MIELLLIGIGTGNPNHLTLEAIQALGSADLVLVPQKGAEKADLAELRQIISARHAGPNSKVVTFDLPVRDATTPQYLDGVNAWHDAIAHLWGTLVAEHLPHGGSVALLVWGDPSLYDSSLRIADRLRQAGLDLKIRVIPGLTSLQLLTARHAISLNTLGAPVMITTGRHLRDNGWPIDVDTLAIMLDGACSFQSVPSDGVTIYWAAYLGMPNELVLSGPLADAGPRIISARARARAEHGWIMDIYLLRRGP